MMSTGESGKPRGFTTPSPAKGIARNRTPVSQFAPKRMFLNFAPMSEEEVEKIVELLSQSCENAFGFDIETPNYRNSPLLGLGEETSTVFHNMLSRMMIFCTDMGFQKKK